MGMIAVGQCLTIAEASYALADAMMMEEHKTTTEEREKDWNKRLGSYKDHLARQVEVAVAEDKLRQEQERNRGIVRRVLRWCGLSNG
jgi:hypothetical protein